MTIYEQDVIDGEEEEDEEEEEEDPMQGPNQQHTNRHTDTPVVRPLVPVKTASVRTLPTSIVAQRSPEAKPGVTGRVRTVKQWTPYSLRQWTPQAFALARTAQV